RWPQPSAESKTQPPELAKLSSASFMLLQILVIPTEASVVSEAEGPALTRVHQYCRVPHPFARFCAKGWEGQAPNPRTLTLKHPPQPQRARAKTPPPPTVACPQAALRSSPAKSPRRTGQTTVPAPHPPSPAPQAHPSTP